MNFGGVPPAWDDQTVALVNFKQGKLTCLDTESAVELGIVSRPILLYRLRWTRVLLLLNSLVLADASVCADSKHDCQADSILGVGPIPWWLVRVIDCGDHDVSERGAR